MSSSSTSTSFPSESAQPESSPAQDPMPALCDEDAAENSKLAIIVEKIAILSGRSFEKEWSHTVNTYASQYPKLTPAHVWDLMCKVPDFDSLKNALDVASKFARDVSDDSSSDEFFEPAPGPIPNLVANEPQKPWSFSETVSSYLPAVLKPEIPVRHIHSVDPKDRTLLQNIDQTIGELPSKARTVANAALTDLFGGSVPNVPAALLDIVAVLCDVLSITLSESPVVWAAVTTRMALERGLTSSLIVSGLSVLVQQFIKRYRKATDQNGEKLTLPAATEQKIDAVSIEEDATVSGFSALWSLVWSYTMGVMPSISMPTDLIKQLVALNVALTFARNVEHFGTYIAAALKYMLDAIWNLVFGVPFFNQAQVEAARSIAETSAEIEPLLSDDAVSKANVRRLADLVDEANAQLAVAAARGVKKDVLDQFERLIKSAQRWCSFRMAEAQLTEPRPQPVLFQLLGSSGVGKTLIFHYIFGALKKLRGYPGTLESNIHTIQKNVNFQAPPPKNMKFIRIDDAFLITDAERFKTFLEFLADIASPKPMNQDAPGIDQKMMHWLDPEFVGCSDNKIPHQLPVSTPDAVPRRFIGGIHRVHLNNKYGEDGRLNPDLIIHITDPKILQAALNEVWVFIDQAGVKRNFTQLVTMLDHVATTMHARAARNVQAQAVLEANFERGAEPVILSKPPRSFEFYHGSATDQSFVNYESDAKLDSYLRVTTFTQQQQDAFNSRVRAFMRASPSAYTFKDRILLCGKQVVKLEDLVAKFHFHQAKDKPDIHVHLDDLRPEHLRYMRDGGLEFRVKNGCCMHGTWCFVHGESLCEALDDDAVVTDYSGLANWVVRGYDKPLPTQTYHRIIAATVPQGHLLTRYPTLKLVAQVVLGLGVGWLIGAILNRVLASYRTAVDQSGYTSHGAKSSKQLTPGVPKASFGRPKAQDQADANAPQVKPTDWVLAKLAANVVPIRVTTGAKSLDLQMLRVVGNIAVAPRHAFPPGFDFVHIGGLLASTLPVRRVQKAIELVCGPFVQVLPDLVLDLCAVILPKEFPPCTNIMKYLISSSTPATQLIKTALAVRDLDNVVPVDGKVVPSVLPPLREFPLGDVQGAYAYDSSARFTGLYVNTATSTVSGQCGFPAYTTNTRTGRGHAIIIGILVAKSDANKNESILAPVTREAMDDLIKDCPSGVLNLAVLQSKASAVGPLDNLSVYDSKSLARVHEVAPQVPIVGTIPAGDRQYQNTKNTIRPAPELLANALVGLEIDSPLGGGSLIVPPIDVAAAPVHDLYSPLKKIVPNAFVPTSDSYELHCKAILQVEHQINKFTDKKLVQPQTRLFTTHEALNGVPDLGIQGLDMTKSPGYHPGAGRKSRSEYATCGDNGQWDMKPEYELVVQEMIATIGKGQLPESFVVTNGKVELRPFGKNARITSCYWFALLVAMRCYSMHLPAMIISGRVHNGMSFGCDLNGRDGQIAGSAQVGKRLNSSADATNFDASQSCFAAGPAEEVAGRAIRARFPFVSREASLIVPMLSRVVWVVFGALVWYRFHSLQSGHPLTTYLNCLISSAIGLAAWLKSKPPPGSDYFRDVFAQAYGDDYRAAHNHQGFGFSQIKEAGAAVGITYTGVAKDSSNAEFVSGYQDTHLKRFKWQDVSGFFHYPLQLSTVSHIHAFYHANDKDVSAALTQACDSALREWFHYGRTTFELVKQRLNSALLLLGHRLVNLDYDALYAAWFNNLRGAHMNLLYGEPDEAPVPYIRRATDQSAVSEHSSPLGDTITTAKVNESAATPTTSDSGVVSQHKLTKYLDGSLLSSTAPTPAAHSSAVTPLNPYPRQGVEQILEREYPVATFNWLAADNFGTVYFKYTFPEVGFVPAKISEQLSTFRYFRAGCKVTVRVNGNQFVGGALCAAWIPYHTGEPMSNDLWRENANLLMNGPNVLISASKAPAVAFELPWCAPNTWYDIQQTQPVGAIGTVIIFVACKQEWMSAAPPPHLSVTVYARFTDVQVAGNDFNPGPSLAQRIARGPAAAPQNPQKNHPTQPRPKADKQAGWRQRLLKGATYRGSATDQSASFEAAQKATSGALTGVDSAVKTVDAVINTVSHFLEFAPLLDKPMEVAAVQPVRNVVASDLIHTEGVSQNQAMAAPIAPYVSTTNGLVAEANPNPSWSDLVQIPAVLKYFTFLPGAVKGDVIAQWFVSPTGALAINEAGDNKVYLPGPMAYYSGFHRYWHGDIKYLIRLFGPPTQKGTLRVTVLPNTSATTGIADTVAGDVETIVADVVGDTDIMLTVRYLSRNTQLVRNMPFGGLNVPLTAFARVVVQVVSELSSQVSPGTCSVSAIVYVAGGENFVFSSPCELPRGWSVNTSGDPPPVIMLDTEHRKQFDWDDDDEDDHNQLLVAKEYRGKATNQASVRDMFGKPFPSLSKSSCVGHRGIVDPDRTSGLVELLKRYVIAIDAFSPPLLFTGQPLPGADGASMLDLCLPFKSWSGSINFKFAPTILWAGGVSMLVVDKVESIDDPAGTLGGSVMTTLNMDPVLSVTCPYQQPNPIRPFFEDYPENEDLLSYRVRALSPEVELDMWQAAGDDFRVYHFMACPFWHWVPPPPAPK